MNSLQSRNQICVQRKLLGSIYRSFSGCDHNFTLQSINLQVVGNQSPVISPTKYVIFFTVIEKVLNRLQIMKIHPIFTAMNYSDLKLSTLPNEHSSQSMYLPYGIATQFYPSRKSILCQGSKSLNTDNNIIIISPPLSNSSVTTADK